MNVIFSTKSTKQNRYTISHVEGHGKVWFDKGVKTTSDKDLIKKLMQKPQYRRGDYYLVTNPELVDKYLNNEDPDVLTKEILDSLTIKGIKELGKLLSARNDKPTLIKVEVEGLPITDAVQEILDFYTLTEHEQNGIQERNSKDNKQSKKLEEEKNVQRELQSEVRETEEERSGKQQEEVLSKSIDYNATDAIKYIENASLEELQGFIPKDESRKTVLRAFDKRMKG